jgi:hypothetical protein
MYKCLIILMILCSGVVQAQYYATLGVGFSGVFYTTNDFDQFTQTYNAYNRSYLVRPLETIDNAFGIRWDVGFRKISTFNLALNLGYQSFLDNGVAQYGNNEQRDFKFNQKHFFLDAEFGYKIDQYLINSVATLFINRVSSLESIYVGDESDPNVASLSGTYKTEPTYALDLGIVFGIIKKPFLIITKVTYPVYTGGKDIYYRDKDQKKIQQGLDAFPRDYFDYMAKGDYPAVRSNVDGLKFMISLNYLISIKSTENSAPE